MLNGPVEPVEVFLYWAKAIFGNFYRPGASSSLLTSSPVLLELNPHCEKKTAIIK